VTCLPAGRPDRETQPKLVARKIEQIYGEGDGKKKAPCTGPFFWIERWLLYSRLQNPPQRRHAGDLPFFPHLIDHVLNMREVLFFKMIEAALLGEEILYGNSFLAGLARNQATLRDATSKIQR